MSDAYPRLVLPVEWKVDAIDIAHVGRLAQLARASPLQGEGRGFKSLNAHFGGTTPLDFWSSSPKQEWLRSSPRFDRERAEFPSTRML